MAAVKDLQLKVTEEVYLSPFSVEDLDELVEHLNDEEIYRNSLVVPQPYTRKDAHEWLYFVNTSDDIHFAVRKQGGSLIGGIGFQTPASAHLQHQADVGYWLTKSWRGKGLMPEVLRVVCRFGFEEKGHERITAHIFVRNRASERVLEKAGFTCEATLKKFYKKDGQFIDGKLYRLLREEFEHLLHADKE